MERANRTRPARRFPARLLLVGALAGLLAAPAGALAQARKKKVIRLETITVEGRIQKPQAFYILQRSNLSFDELERSESFLHKVVQSANRDPF